MDSGRSVTDVDTLALKVIGLFISTTPCGDGLPQGLPLICKASFFLHSQRPQMRRECYVQQDVNLEQAR